MYSLLSSLGVGSAGPASFGLGLKQTLIIILIVDVMYVFHHLASKRQAENLLSVAVLFRHTCKHMIILEFQSGTNTPYSAVFGPKLGARSMVQARYSWG